MVSGLVASFRLQAVDRWSIGVGVASCWVVEVATKLLANITNADITELRNTQKHTTDEFVKRVHAGFFDLPC
jgi:hypothetical protein